MADMRHRQISSFAPKAPFALSHSHSLLHTTISIIARTSLLSHPSAQLIPAASASISPPQQQLAMACVAALTSSSVAALAASASSSSTRSSAAASASLGLRRSLLHGNQVVLSSRRAESMRLNPAPIRAVSDDPTSDSAAQVQQFVDDLKAKWDATENKTTVVVYGGGALVALWLSSTVVGAINAVPLLPKLLELVGLSYTGWFVYRYLLFKSSRKELVEDIEALKGKITGAVESDKVDSGSLSNEVKSTANQVQSKIN